VGEVVPTPSFLGMRGLDPRIFFGGAQQGQSLVL